MLRQITSSILGVVCAACGQIGYDPLPAGTDANSNPPVHGVRYFRRPVILTSVQVGPTLTGFPVPIEIRDDVHLSQHAGAPNQIRFVVGGITLSHEINHANIDSGSIFAWVKLPSFPLSETLYLEYGPEVAPEGSDALVWTNEYAGVYHFDNSTPTNLVDSATGTMGVPELMPMPNQPGKHGSGNSGCWSLGDVFDFADRQPFSVSFWAMFNNHDSVDYPRLLSNADYETSPSRVGIVFEHSPTGRLVVIRGVGSEQDIVETPDSLPLNSYVHASATYDGSLLSVYINGELAGTILSVGSMPVVPSDFEIGCEDAFLDFDGLLDEVRVSRVARAAAWVKATHALEANSLVELGTIETISD